MAWPAGVPTQAAHTHDSHTIGAKAGTSGGNVAVTAPTTHSSLSPAISWPAGVPTNSGGAVDAHGVTNNAVTSGNPSATLAHSVTQPSDHSAMSVVQPYVVVYFWKRTA